MVLESAMQKFKLLTLTFAIGLAANTAAADIAPPQMSNAMKVATIEKMYQQDAHSQGQDHPTALQQYSTQKLQAAMQLEQDYFDKEEMSCNVGYDVLWDSQDPDYAQDKQFSVTEQGLVQVSLAQGSDVYYDLSCDDSSCQVIDVILDDDGTSLKDYLIEACR